MKKHFNKLVPCGMLLFPLCIYLLEFFKAPLFFSILLLFCALGAHLHSIRFQGKTILIMIVILLVASILSFYKKENLVRIYPFVISLHFTILFVNKTGDGLPVTAFYASKFKPLKPWEMDMLKKINPLWSFGLALNTFVLLIFIFRFSTALWALYAGGLSYVLLAILFMITFAYGIIYRA
ncbi:MAG: hypothetical protein HQK54_00495 [Oligoflexales bacterium]|nr:hypothetical protein [Oligoflexales bacterium]